MFFFSPLARIDGTSQGRTLASDAEPSALGGCHRLTCLKWPRLERPALAGRLRADGLADRVGRAISVLHFGIYGHLGSPIH